MGKSAAYKVEPLCVLYSSGYLAGQGSARPVDFYRRPGSEPRADVPMREVVCYACGRSSRIPVAALSAHCVHCRAHLDTADYTLCTGMRRHTLRTLGNVVIPESVVLSHLDIVCENLSVAGRVSGSFEVAGRLTLRAQACLEGQVSARDLVVSAGTRASISPAVSVQAAKLGGELTTRLNAAREVLIKHGGILHGDCRTQNLVVQAGGVHDGQRVF